MYLSQFVSLTTTTIDKGTDYVQDYPRECTPTLIAHLLKNHQQSQSDFSSDIQYSLSITSFNAWYIIRKTCDDESYEEIYKPSLWILDARGDLKNFHKCVSRKNWVIFGGQIGCRDCFIFFDKQAIITSLYTIDFCTFYLI